MSEAKPNLNDADCFVLKCYAEGYTCEPERAAISCIRSAFPDCDLPELKSCSESMTQVCCNCALLKFSISLSLFVSNNVCVCQALLWPIGQPFLRIKKSSKDEGEMFTLQSFERLVNAVRRVHRCGYVHRDIKPENIFSHEVGDPFFGVSTWSVF